jgi:hypothetical protein
MTEFVVLGLRPDPRMFGSSPVSSPEVQEAAMEYILTYPDGPAEHALMHFFFDLLVEGGLELFFGLLEFLI